MKSRIQTLLNHLNHDLVERQPTVKTALLAVLAGENLLLIGPPGTGKSMIARRIADSLAHDSGEQGYFEYLLTKFSTPEELFGPLSISALKADRYHRNTMGYLPTVKIAFLDEVFKASSSILNALLTILNERLYHNGAEVQAVRLQTLIGASNELPNGQEELSALYDRFMMRSFVDYVSPAGLSLLFTKPTLAPETVQLSTGELREIQEAAAAVALPPQIIDAVQRIWLRHKEVFKEDRRESLSDRRLRKLVGLLGVSAATNGRKEVDLSDVLLLKDCLWNHPDNASKVRELILDVLRGFSYAVPQGEQLIAIPPPARSAAQRVVKGLEGSGTESDPLLISTLQDLASLDRSDVGLNGYYFRQAANIDGSKLSTWPNIKFKGHYDGNGHTIKYKNQDDDSYLFDIVQAQSTITNLTLQHLGLAANVEKSAITFCRSNLALVQGTLRKSSISRCETAAPLVLGAAIDSTITDCVGLADRSWDDSVERDDLAGIATIISKGTVLERCFVSGRIKNTGASKLLFCGMAAVADVGTIRYCALGKLDIKRVTNMWTLNRGILAGITTDHERAKLENNIFLATTISKDEMTGNDGKAVDAELFNQAYFEHAMHWDFEHIWQWNDKQERPELRPFSAAYASPVAVAHGMSDLLTQQVQANLWL